MRDSEKVRAFELRRSGKTYEQIAEILSDEADDGWKFDRATIYRACKAMPDLPIDNPFEWHRLEEYGLPWEASAYLLQVWSHRIEYWRGTDRLIDEERPEEDPNHSDGPLTARRARWCWRIHLADPELNVDGVLSLSAAFESRDLVHELLNVPLELKDLEVLLAYKPWANEERLEAYRSALIEKRIPFIEGMSASATELIPEAPGYFLQYIGMRTRDAFFKARYSFRREKT